MLSFNGKRNRGFSVRVAQMKPPAYSAFRLFLSYKWVSFYFMGPISEEKNVASFAHYASFSNGYILNFQLSLQPSSAYLARSRLFNSRSLTLSSLMPQLLPLQCYSILHLPTNCPNFCFTSDCHFVLPLFGQIFTGDFQ